jgi:Protein of unknown function (DUF4238)
VAFQRDLYNLQGLQDSLGVTLALRTLEMRYGCDLSELNFEKTLMGEIDRKGADALQRFRTDPDAPVDQFILFDLLRFLYLLENRNPLILKRLQESSVKHLEQLAKSAGLENSALLKIDDFRNDLTSAKISVIEAILNKPEFIRRYDGLACILCDIDPTVNRYITSDVAYIRLPGVTQQFHLAPLSPTRCLVMSNQRELVEGIKRNTNEHFVDFVNFVVMSMSNEIYAWDDRVRPDVAEYLGLIWRDPLRAGQILVEKSRRAIGR